MYHDGSWVITSPAVADGKVYYATSDSALYNVVDATTGKPVVQEQGNAYMFSSPAIAGDVVVIGVSNGSLEARDRANGKLLWEFQTEAAKQNLGWVLTAQRKFNNSLLFRVQWQDATTVAVERVFAVGSIFSSPLVANGARLLRQHRRQPVRDRIASITARGRQGLPDPSGDPRWEVSLYKKGNAPERLGKIAFKVTLPQAEGSAKYGPNH